MSKHDSWHQASAMWYSDPDTDADWYCMACGRAVAVVDPGTPRTVRHKGNVSTFKTGFSLTDRDGRKIATIAGNSHSHSGW